MFRKVLFIFLLVIPGLVLAEDLSQEQIEELLAVKIRYARHMAFNPSIVRAVESQNGQQLALAEIKRRDDEWKNAGGNLTELIKNTTQNPGAQYFPRRVENNAAIDEVVPAMTKILLLLIVVLIAYVLYLRTKRRR